MAAQELDIRIKPISEKQFMRQVTDLATLRGWSWLHLRPSAGYSARDSWRTAADGPLAKGWPDLFLCRGDEMMFIELKSQVGRTTPEQDKVLAILSIVGFVRVYDPSDWDLIEDALR